jgi:hypothetical protein
MPDAVVKKVHGCGMSPIDIVELDPKVRNKLQFEPHGLIRVALLYRSTSEVVNFRICTKMHLGCRCSQRSSLGLWVFKLLSLKRLSVRFVISFNLIFTAAVDFSIRQPLRNRSENSANLQRAGNTNKDAAQFRSSSGSSRRVQPSNEHSNFA